MARKNKTPELPVFKAFVPDPEDKDKLICIGQTKTFQSNKGFAFHVDDEPRSRQLAYENLGRIIFLKSD